jgi:UDP-N-acetylglucosamine 2-epimerase (non-hydrolysing)
MKVLVALGTRPEAIKLGPIICELKSLLGEDKVLVCNTEQHKHLVANVLELFQIKSDFELGDVLASILVKFSGIVRNCKPDFVILQGDTMTTLGTALAAAFEKVKVIHVEAGLRTGDKANPFPEEINRVLISQISDLHFAATNLAKSNLLSEGIGISKIHVVGNTGIDAVLRFANESQLSNHAQINENILEHKYQGILQYPGPLDWENKSTQEMIFVTMHRRESFGEPMTNAIEAIIELANNFPHITFIFTVHPNPFVTQCLEIAKSKVKVVPSNFITIPPQDYLSTISFMKRSLLILTDSGGIQEEAPALKIPVLVLREKTERIEAVETGASILVGTTKANIVNQTTNLILNKELRKRMSEARNPYGDGLASKRIAEIILKNSSN